MTSAKFNVNKPIAYHFLFVPHAPEDVEVLLDADGAPIWSDYRFVDWKGLAVSARSAIDQLVPKSVRLYVADDAADVMETLNLCIESGCAVKGWGTVCSRFKTAVAKIKMTDMRAGITKITQFEEDYHINPEIDFVRPPLGGGVMSLRFSSSLQALDYCASVVKAIFGCSMVVGNGLSPKQNLGVGEMHQVLHEWLERQFGAVYGRKCQLFMLGTTTSECQQVDRAIKGEDRFNNGRPLLMPLPIIRMHKSRVTD